MANTAIRLWEKIAIGLSKKHPALGVIYKTSSEYLDVIGKEAKLLCQGNPNLTKKIVHIEFDTACRKKLIRTTDLMQIHRAAPFYEKLVVARYNNRAVKMVYFGNAEHIRQSLDSLDLSCSNPTHIENIFSIFKEELSVNKYDNGFLTAEPNSIKGLEVMLDRLAGVWSVQPPAYLLSTQ